jgi:type II secretory pathway pseudopilin PulG
MRIKPLWAHLINNKWATIIELMMVLAILGLGITALLQTMGWGISYARDTENNIKAINIAREWIETMTNIRDTNWLRFSSDKVNCWKVKDYAAGCIGNAVPSNIADGSYTIYSRSGVWFLSGTTGTPYTSWNTYKAEYPIGIDALGFYTQTGIINTPCSSTLQQSCKTIFTREIIVSSPGASTWTVNIQSIARWQEDRPRSVILETTLTNWRSNF